VRPRWEVSNCQSLKYVFVKHFIIISQSSGNWMSHIFYTKQLMAWSFAEYNQQGATFLNLFISVRHCTCFRRFFCPSSGAQYCTYSVTYLSDQYCYLLLAWPGLQQVSIYVQFWAPDDGWKNRVKHVERLTEINKLRNIILLVVFCEYISDAWTYEC